LVIFFLDNRFRVLPSALHGYLPQHHSGFVITDITVKRCSSVNFFSSCKVEGESWHRIEKDLYLGSSYFSSAYVDVQRKKEEELKPDDKVILDIVVGRLDPSGKKGEGDERWDAKPEGIWVKSSAKRHASDEKTVVTDVDVLFGPDAVDPREGWEVKDTGLLLGSGEAHQPRLSIRRGSHSAPTKPVLHIGENGKFKILQVADLHLSTGVGDCRDAMPADGSKCEADTRTLEFIGKMLDEEKPDLVVLSGDQVNGDTAKDAQTVWSQFLLVMTAFDCMVGNF